MYIVDVAYHDHVLHVVHIGRVIEQLMEKKKKPALIKMNLLHGGYAAIVKSSRAPIHKLGFSRFGYVNGLMILD